MSPIPILQNADDLVPVSQVLVPPPRVSAGYGPYCPQIRGRRRSYLVSVPVAKFRHPRTRCDICDKEIRAADIHRHRKQHWDIRAYQCTVCQTRHSEKYNAVNHVKRMHHKGEDAANFVIKVM